MTEAEVRNPAVRVDRTMPMEDVSRAFEKGETQGFMKILVDKETSIPRGALSVLTRRDRAHDSSTRCTASCPTP